MEKKDARIEEKGHKNIEEEKKSIRSNDNNDVLGENDEKLASNGTKENAEKLQTEALQRRGRLKIKLKTIISYYRGRDSIRSNRKRSG